jgi:hypothetical protein
MKKILVFSLLLASVTLLSAQANKADLLQNLENGQTTMQSGNPTATLKSSSRLFGAKDDLTTVVMIIPSGSVVEVLGSDSTYFKVLFEESEGYIFRKHAVIDKTPAANRQAVQYQQSSQQTQQPQPEVQKEVSRFTYLENKYGTNMAARLISGKIWKGMNSEMVKDSWGTALKINRDVQGNNIKEEWIFSNTWLYFENNTLVDWGPVTR